MRDNDRDNSLDSRIDAVLRAYAEPADAPDPRVIALRLLQQGREVESHRNWLLWRWAVPAAVCLILLATVIAWRLRSLQRPQVAQTHTLPQTLRPAKPAAAVVRHAAVAAAPRKPPRLVLAKSRPLPKLDVFPTPTPLSPQERALVAFAEHGPPAVQRAVLQDQKDWNNPVTIAGLQPHPLQPANFQDQ